MRVNVYAEEMTDRIEIIAKEIDGRAFTGLRFYLELPATVNGTQHQGPFMHRPGDDDSAAVTFWGKRDLRVVLRKALIALDTHYAGASAMTEAGAVAYGELEAVIRWAIEDQHYQSQAHPETDDEPATEDLDMCSACGSDWPCSDAECWVSRASAALSGSIAGDAPKAPKDPKDPLPQPGPGDRAEKEGEG